MKCEAEQRTEERAREAVVMPATSTRSLTPGKNRGRV